MRMTRHTAVAALGLTAALALTACSSAGTAGGGSSDGPQTVPTTKGDGETLTVWVMTGDYTDETIAAINDEFTAQTGAKVDVQTQQWDGITTKISTALATSTPPDVLDLGNTQVASYAANGALLDLTPYRDDLKQGQTWLTGLEEPATVDDSLYAVPGFAGARAVIYNKTMWAQAGITEAPTTYDELTADLDALKATLEDAEASSETITAGISKLNESSQKMGAAMYAAAEADQAAAGGSTGATGEGDDDIVDADVVDAEVVDDEKPGDDK